MASRTRVLQVDDLDGVTTENVKVVSFGLDGAGYEIDLSAEHAAELREALARFMAAARKVRPAKRASSTGRNRRDERPRPAEVRAWAREAGQDVPDRGRIPSAVVDAYRAAHTA